MTQSVEQLKQEISEVYLKEFKKELWRLKSLTLLPIEKKVKNILVWKSKLPEKFDQIEEFWWWKNIINFVSPSIALQIYNFMKEKSEEIEKRRTSNELVDLKNEILWNKPEEKPQEQKPEEQEQKPEDETQTPEDQTETPVETPEDETQESEEQEQKPEDETQTSEEQTETSEEKTQAPENEETNSLSIWARFALFWTAWVHWLWKLSNRIDRSLMEKSLDAQKIKETINWSINQLKKQRDALWSRLSDAQVQTINKHIEKMEKWLDIPDADLSEVLKERQKLWNKFPGTLLESAWLNISQIKKLQKLSGELCGKPLDEMRAILEKNWINDIWDELLQTLWKASSPSEIKSMAKILRHGSKFNRFMQTLSWAMLIDVAFSWLDVRMFIEQRKEAELIAKVNEARASNKNDQAWTQLGIWVSSVVAEALIIGFCLWWSSWGPVWAAVWIAVGAITWAASMAVDSLYFDVKDFYLQNKDDFLRQKKSRITEAILQWVHNKKVWNTTINEKIWSLGLDSGEKENSTEAACRALMFLDELDGEEFWNYAPFWEYLNKWKTKEDYLKEATNWLSEKEAEEVRTDFEEHWGKMENKIAKRMKYMKEIFKKDDVIDALKNWNWIKTINELCVESRIYEKVWQENRQWDISRESYKSNLDKLKSDFFKDFSAEKLVKLEKLKEDNITLFQELISTSNYYSLLKEDEENSNYTENVKLIEKYQEWLKLTEINADKIWLRIEDTHRNMKFIESLIRADFDLNWISEFSWNDDERVIDIINENYERRWTMEVSDDVWQNILYRLAKELYSYNWPNNKEWIMAFFDEWEDWVHGIYYSDERKMNRDRKVDQKVYKEWIDKIFASEDEVKEYVENFMNNNFTDTVVVSNGSPYWSAWNTHIITTDRDTIDTPTEAIDKNLQIELKRVFKEILTQELMQRTEQNQESIKNEITDFVKKYSKWNYVELPYYLLTKARRAWLWNLERQFYKWNNDQLELCTLPTELWNNPLWAKINYVTKSRESYTSEEQVYIDRVELAQKNLTDLFNFQWWMLWKWEESDLDIPREVKWLVSDKYKEWNDFKERLLLYSPDVASSMLDEYNKFAEYFENLYRWMLLALTTYKTSNDIDSYSLFQQAESLWNSNYFWENWEIKTDFDIDFFKNGDIKSFYNDQIKKQKIKYICFNWKDEKEATIEQLRKSEESDERELAKRASNLIIMTIAEQWVLNRWSSWEITWINICGNWKDSDLTKWVKELKDKTESLITDRLKNIKWRVLINPSKIETKKQTIQTLRKEETETVTESVNVQKIIEDTAKNIERQNERWNIIYDPVKKTIKSWWNEIKIDVSHAERNSRLTRKEKTVVECKLDWLPENLDIREWLRLANFRNWARKKYKWKKIEVWKGKHVVWKDTLVVDADPSDWFWTRIITREALDKNLPTFNSDEWRKKIAEWLTDQIA